MRQVCSPYAHPATRRCSWSVMPCEWSWQLVHVKSTKVASAVWHESHASVPPSDTVRPYTWVVPAPSGNQMWFEGATPVPLGADEHAAKTTKPARKVRRSAFDGVPVRRGRPRPILEKMAEGQMFRMRASPSDGWSFFPNQKLQTTFMKSTPAMVAVPPPSTVTVTAFEVELYTMVTT